MSNEIDPIADVEVVRAVGRLAILVNSETPSRDVAALRAGIDRLVPMVRESLGREPEILALDGGVPALLLRATAQPAVLLLCHLDTVWPLGSLADHPFSAADGRATGPGGFDMKAGIVIGLAAIEAIEAPGARDHVTLLVTCDEEVGSAASRALLERVAMDAIAVLVLEGSGPGGALKEARKGISMYDLEITGRAAHAGLEPERGINATAELAHLVLDIAGLGDPALGTTVTPTMASSGTSSNTVPAAAHLAVDVRAWTVDEQLRVDAAIRARTPAIDGATVTVHGGINRPPLERERAASLLELARAVAAANDLGEVAACAVGGASDGNFTAALGIPTLDGLGAVGGNAHASGEWVDLGTIPGRARLIARLVERIVSGVQPPA
ncbi:MAG: M20 family metallopeptidase [Chloroflexota bacterium]